MRRPPLEFPYKGKLIGITSITGTGTQDYVPTSGTRSGIVYLTGAGAGGGGAATDGSGGGGSAGGTAIKYYASLATGAALDIGVGGTGGAAGANNGSTGVTSSFRSLVAEGGLAGAGGGSLTAAAGGQNSATQTTGGDVNLFGGDGEHGQSATNIFRSGHGGGSYWGGGAIGGLTNVGRNGLAFGGGGGGGGGAGAVAGGDGADGICVIYEYG